MARQAEDASCFLVFSELSCTSGSSAACFDVAWALAHGYGTEADSGTAIAVASYTCTGSVSGTEALRLATLIEDQGDAERAEQCLQSACRRGRVQACRALR